MINVVQTYLLNFEFIALINDKTTTIFPRTSHLLYYFILINFVFIFQKSSLVHVLHLSCKPTQNQLFFSFFFLMCFFFSSHPNVCLFFFSLLIFSSTHTVPFSLSLSLSCKNEETSPPSFHSHTHKLNYSIHNQTHKSYLPIIYRRSNHTFHLQRSFPIYYHFQLPHFTQ